RVLLDGEGEGALDGVAVAGDHAPLDRVGAGGERLGQRRGRGRAVDGGDDLGELGAVLVGDPHQRAHLEDVGGEGEGDVLGRGLEGGTVLGVGAEQRVVRLRGGRQREHHGEQQGAAQGEQRGGTGGGATELGHRASRLRQGDAGRPVPPLTRGARLRGS